MGGRAVILPALNYFFVALVLLLLDWLCCRSLMRLLPVRTRRIFVVAYMAFSGLIVTFAMAQLMRNPVHLRNGMQAVLVGVLSIWFLPKVLALPLFVAAEVREAIARRKGKREEGLDKLPKSPTRRRFFEVAGVAVAGLGMSSLLGGVALGGYRYRIHRHTIALKRLPPGFDGLTIVQLSDIHTGSLLNRAAARHGLAMARALKPDMFVFTGDLVNNVSAEAEDWTSELAQFAAPMGKYCVLGNHDFGDYVKWENPADREANLDRLKNMYKQTGWRLLTDEHLPLHRNGDVMTLAGCQNWSIRSEKQRYGSIANTLAGAPPQACTLLLSHDPSHWDAKIRPQFPWVDLTLSGHTHGFQFGVEVKGYRFSPSQWLYKQWAGLFAEGGQQIYVNRGFGFVGYPGRLGIWPEITHITLRKG